MVNKELIMVMMAILVAVNAWSAATLPHADLEGGLTPFLSEADIEFTNLFEGDRFPNVAVAMDGTVLAFWNGVMVRRSQDGGRTWGPTIEVGKDGFTCFTNPGDTPMLRGAWRA